MTPQVDNLQYQHGGLLRVYHLDTAVIIWKAEDVEGANRARDYIKSLTPRRHRGRHVLHRRLRTSLWLRLLRLRWRWRQRIDAAVVDQVAAGFGCETEIWIGSADEITQLKELAVPEYVKVA